MAIDKNFVVRNGIEVAENLIVASTSLDAVGLGTTTPSSKVDVAGGITADNILVRSNGITTSLGEFNVGTGGTIISAIPDTSLIGLHTASPTFAVQIDNPTGNSTSFYVKEGDVNINTGGLRVGGASTFTGNIDANGDLDVDGHTELDDLNVSGVSTFAGNIDADGDLDVDGTTELDILNVAETATFTGNIDANGDLDVDGHTELDHINVSAASTFGGLVDINANGQANSFKVEDLTDNRVVISGTGGELEDDANFTFDGNQLALGVGLTVTGVSTFAGNIDANGDLDVDGFTELDDVNVSGAITATTFTGNLAGTASTATIATYTSNWILESGDGSNYGISGPGLTGTENDPTFHLTRGEKYKFTNNTGGHPFRIQSTSNGSVGTQYDDGITNNDAGDGTTLLWDVQMDAPNILYYQCTSHDGMGGKIYIGNSGSSIDVDGHTETDTLNVSGLSTFVGLSTFNDGIIVVSGVSTLGVTTATNLTLQQLNVSGVSTFSDNVKITTLTENRIPIIGVGSTIEDDANFTFDGTQLALGVGLTVTGVSTFAGNIDANGDLDVDGHTELDDLQVSGVTTFTDTTENTLGDVNTGSVQLDGGIGVDGNVTVGGALSVTGNSYFVGMVTFAAGTDGNISLGDANTDNVIFNADVNSNIIPNTTSTYDLGSSSQKWRDFYLSGNAGIGSLNVTGVSTLGVTTATNLTLQQLNVSGLSTLGVTTLTNTTTQQLNVSGVSTLGITTATNLTLQQLNVSGVSTLGITTLTDVTLQQLNVSGVSTLGVTTATNLTLEQLNVSGVSTLGITTLTDVTAQQLNVSGLSTFVGLSTFNDGIIIVSGVSTLGVTTATNLTLQQLNVSGVSTLGITTATNLTLQQLNVSGVSTFAGNIDANGDLDVDGHTELDDLNVSGVSTLGVTTLTSTLNVSGIITAQSGVDITGGNTKIKGAVETVSVGSYSGDILTLDTELGTLFTHDLQSGSIGIVSITNFPVTSNTFHTVTLLLNQNSTGTGNTTTETGIGTNITLTPDGVSGFNTTPISSFGANITASITPEDIDVVTFGIHYNGSGTGTPANYKVFITKNGSFRYG